MTNLMKGNLICPYIKKHTGLFLKGGEVCKKLPDLFKSHQGLFDTYSGTSLYLYMCKPTRIYASGYTDVRISLHIYMSLCQIPSYPVPEFDLFASSSRQTLFYVVYL